MTTMQIDALEPSLPTPNVHVSGSSGKSVLILAVRRKLRKNSWAKALRAKLQDAGHTVTFSGDISEIDSQDEVVIWNGEMGRDKQAAKVCRERSLNHCFLELGFFSQRDHFMLSRHGSVGRNLLRGEDIPENSPEDEAFLDEYFYRYGLGRVRQPANHVIVMLQLESDTSITNHSPFKRMQALVDYAEFRWGTSDIVIKTHPKDRKIRLNTKRQIIRGGSLWDHLLHAKLCVGINSTSLYEAILAAIPTVSVGGCVLHEKPDQHRAIVREIIRRQIPTGPNCPDFEERFKRSVGRSIGATA